MPVILQEKLIQWILLPLSRVTEKVPRAAREAAISLSIAGIIFFQFAVNSGLYQGRYLIQFAIGCFLFGVMILCGLTPDLRPVRFSPMLKVCWLGSGFFALLTGVLVETDRLVGAILFLAVFPVFFLVWSGPGFDRLFPPVIRGVMLSFLFFTVVSVFFYPLNGINYASFYTNRNGTGFYLTAVFVCLLCFIFTQDRYSPCAFAAYAAIGFTAATIYYTNSRTSIFAIAICFLSASVLQLLIHKKNWRHVLRFQVLPVAVAAALLVPSAAYLYHGCYRLSSAVQAALASVDAPDMPDAPDAPSVSEVMEAMKDYQDYRFYDYTIPTNEALSPMERVINSLTSGRVALWHIYLREIRFLGHRTGAVVYDSAGELVMNGPHFTPFEFAYANGALSGVFFLLLNILAGLASIHYAVTRRDVRYRLAPFAIAITFGAVSAVADIGGALGFSLSLLYYLSLAPLIIISPTEERQPEEKELS